MRQADDRIKAALEWSAELAAEGGVTVPIKRLHTILNDTEVQRPTGLRLMPRQAERIGDGQRDLYVGATTPETLSLTHYYKQGEASMRLTRPEAIRLRACITDWLAHDEAAY